MLTFAQCFVPRKGCIGLMIGGTLSIGALLVAIGLPMMLIGEITSQMGRLPSMIIQAIVLYPSGVLATYGLVCWRRKYMGNVEEG